MRCNEVAVAVSEPVSRSEISVFKCFSSIMNSPHLSLSQHEFLAKLRRFYRSVNI
ncbi:Uncharacterised protein [Vibrio cholerae]|nr:Uncharacterised protein [Vibrio cholerae]